MTVRPDGKDIEAHAGLCATCAHAKTVGSSKGSTFFLCMLSETDPRFRKYPRLPVQSCTGYQRKD